MLDQKRPSISVTKPNALFAEITSLSLHGVTHAHIGSHGPQSLDRPGSYTGISFEIKSNACQPAPLINLRTPLQTQAKLSASASTKMPSRTSANVVAAEAETPTCSICFEVIGHTRADGLKEGVATTACHHRFGNICLTQWRMRDNTLCPECRAPLCLAANQPRIRLDDDGANWLRLIEGSSLFTGLNTGIQYGLNKLAAHGEDASPVLQAQIVDDFLKICLKAHINVSNFRDVVPEPISNRSAVRYLKDIAKAIDGLEQDQVLARKLEKMLLEWTDNAAWEAVFRKLMQWLPIRYAEIPSWWNHERYGWTEIFAL